MTESAEDTQPRQALTPYLIVKRAEDAIAFYKEAFGATELFRLAGSDGRIGHAELRIVDSAVMLADEAPDFGALSPASVGGTPVQLHLYVDDVDRCVERAIAAGATLLRAVKDQFYGDRSGMIVDPFGHKWHVATRIRAVSPQEMQERWNTASGEGVRAPSRRVR
jgi:PhnB protein